MSGRARAERLLDAVRALGPLVEAERASLDRDRALPAPLVDALVDAGLFRLWTPRHLGGAELDPVSGLRVIAAMAALDGSVGWNAMVASAHAFLAGRLHARAAREVFGDRRAVVAGQLEPGGTAEAVRGGYRVSGTWRFASGCRHATWLLAHCVVAERARGHVGACPTTRLVFVPVDRARIHDTWRVSGLRGTGSHDYSLERVLRRFRDVHVATQHVALAPRTLEVAGRVLLGLDPQGIC